MQTRAEEAAARPKPKPKPKPKTARPDIHAAFDLLDAREQEAKTHTTNTRSNDTPAPVTYGRYTDSIKDAIAEELLSAVLPEHDVSILNEMLAESTINTRIERDMGGVSDDGDDDSDTSDDTDASVDTSTPSHHDDDYAAIWGGPNLPGPAKPLAKTQSAPKIDFESENADPINLLEQLGLKIDGETVNDKNGTRLGTVRENFKDSMKCSVCIPLI